MDRYGYRVLTPTVHSVDGFHYHQIEETFERDLDGYNAAHHLAIQKSVENRSGIAFIRIVDVNNIRPYAWLSHEAKYYNGRFVG